MPQGDDEASTMKEALIHAQDAVIAYLDTAEVLQPSIGALDFPAPPIAAELAFVFKAALFSGAQVGSDQLRASIPQPLAQLIRIVTAIRNHTAQALTRAATSTARYSYPRQRAFREPELGDLRGRKLRSDRYTLAVDHHHALRTFPATGFSDCGAPFFASTKVASRKASSQSSTFVHPTGPATLARPAATPPALPTAADDASRWSHGDIRLADRATVRQHGEPRECLRNSCDWRPKVGPVHLSVAAVGRAGG